VGSHPGDSSLRSARSLLMTFFIQSLCSRTGFRSTNPKTLLSCPDPASGYISRRQHQQARRLRTATVVSTGRSPLSNLGATQGHAAWVSCLCAIYEAYTPRQQWHPLGHVPQGDNLLRPLTVAWCLTSPLRFPYSGRLRQLWSARLLGAR
jgi:hypothetical protein